MRKVINAVFFLSVIGSCYSQQQPDLFSIEHKYSPSSKDFDFNSTEIRANIPVKVGKGFITNSIGLDYSVLNYNKSYPFDTKEIETFYNLSYALSYSYPLKKQWLLTARVNPTISSNLKGSLSSEDLLLNGALLATKRWGNFKKGSVMIFGVAYATLSGKPGVIPFISFRQTLNERFSYGIGFPSTFFNYNLNKKNSFRVEARQQGFYANLSGSNSPIFNGEEAQKIQFRNFLANISYSYKFAKGWRAIANAGYSFSNTYSLLDVNKDELYDFDIDNRPFFSIGVAYDLSELIKKRRSKNK
ncbi:MULTISPECIES: DUF6268 family outer membrane beta-barrel protein [unclassified Tenacibaculum]|uniref:DUF6268 family outer membrane beta-barrel protein n=1 Tax=unclassified Tenacibaculum TaxID=2635139 RepID=UPI001F206CB3|nr:MULTISPECIES: DUF6268 family outer membrane beta-barrel protein [unclassified Tenacibaculum]MCF2876360.1 DUF6268 family outer membrane beta-barrel protein [Tenacibaculum sp. Cn5-1]MCF2936497.1 DUF6268 family outer membrane beta-barrel protein [Tenacibaculum sp. Cn5-34]MCG7512778.1 DUF6268 family outer membrane beta-barrel protein [Tenacibaculum sp. Cn5-46]